ncbi:MAG: ATP-binding cassette domain-containing protein [Anaerolineae bacterium]|jgi:ABC-2 type transport system ATP-binding protein
MHTVEVSHVAKSFGPTQAVADVSFAVERGEIFGLLGPNGAGKTTTIRLMLDIFRPDAGTVSILDGPMTEAKKERIGYMPEERGLYQDVTLERSLIYLARIKGLSTAEARRRLAPLLEHFDLAAHRTQKVKELSKGMQQKAQIISTILHRPELLIVDEPFAALDPINARLVKDLMRQLRDEGVTILMSTHQMHQVEELCDRIVLINQGRNVLYGPLDQVRRQFSADTVRVRLQGELPPLTGAVQGAGHNGTMELQLAAGATPQQILEQLVGKGAVVEHFEIAVPTLDEVFIRAVGGQAGEGEDDHGS